MNVENKNISDYDQEGIVLRFERSVRQQVGEITKIVGFVKAKNLIRMIDHLDLQANPRDSKTGAVTDAIQASIDEDPELFPFKTKGILLAASDYENLDRGRIRVFFDNRNIEGILDGGHNTLAIGMLILRRACAIANAKPVRKRVTWNEFKELWIANRNLIAEYQESVRKPENVQPKMGEDAADLSFYVPVELLVPTRPDDKLCVEDFRRNLLEICEARNNNAELTTAAKANQQGVFEELKKLFRDNNPALYDRIEWKTNEGGDIKVRDIVSLAWIALRHAPVAKDSDGKPIEPPSPVKMYSGKEDPLRRFERYMTSSDVSIATSDYTVDLRNPKVYAALKLTTDIPSLYDYIYEKFPSLYNAANGSYGSITAVKKLNASKTVKVTPFGGKTVDKASPEGFIMPLVYGLHILVDPETLTWRTDPNQFLEQNLPAIVKRYAELFQPLGWNPQTIGKSLMSYTTVEDSYKMILAGLLK